MAYLVYVRGLRGPAPMIVFDDAGGRPFLDESMRGNVLAEHRLCGDDPLSLDALTAKYPPPTPASQSVEERLPLSGGMGS